MNINIILLIITFASLVVLGFFMSLSIKKYEKDKKNNKKKKGRLKYTPEGKHKIKK